MGKGIGAVVGVVEELGALMPKRFYAQLADGGVAPDPLIDGVGEIIVCVDPRYPPRVGEQVARIKNGAMLLFDSETGDRIRS